MPSKRFYVVMYVTFEFRFFLYCIWNTWMVDKLYFTSEIVVVFGHYLGYFVSCERMLYYTKMHNVKMNNWRTLIILKSKCRHKQ